MTSDELRALQRPIKERYEDDPDAARITLEADGALDDEIACSVQTGRPLIKAGLHPATGGDGTLACSGDMLLQALVACAGVTMRSVATSMGFEEIRLRFELESDASDEELETLQRLTERYCVVFQTLAASPALSVTLERE
jgi:uncharacterized OsmC-like protein